MKKKSKDFKFDFRLLIAFLTSMIFIYATYAWFSSTLNVDLEFTSIKINTETDISFSLDGENWTKHLTISKKTILEDLEKKYPTNTNKWSRGLTTISSPGTQYSNDYLTFYKGYSFSGRLVNDKKVVVFSTERDKNNERDEDCEYIAFDLFIRNITRKPIDEYLYLADTTSFKTSDGEGDTALNGLRMGMVFSDKIPSRSTPEEMQKLKCTQDCKYYIYEPNSTNHSENSIAQAASNGIIMKDGEYYPTYAVRAEGRKINMFEGVANTGFNINPQYYSEQKTIKDFTTMLYTFRDHVFKVRMYLWIEGQDLDLFVAGSNGYTIDVNIDFRKNK